MKFGVVDAKSCVLILVRCSSSVVIAIFFCKQSLDHSLLVSLLPPYRSAGHDY